MKQRLLCVLVAMLGASGPAIGNNIVTGSSTTADVTLDSASNWKTIRSITVAIPQSDPGVHGCVRDR
jgi:hypothetical protein